MGGSAVGLVNLGMQVAGFAAPVGIGLIIDAFNGSYNGVVWVLAACGILCSIAFLCVNAKIVNNETSKLSYNNSD